MLIAITGANGFLGSYTMSALRRAGHRVRALVHTARQRSTSEPVADEWQVGDQYDPQVQFKLAADADAVIQIAIDWDALNRGPVSNFERNMLGSLRLLEASRLAGVKQFLFVSSMDVYYEILSQNPINEMHPAWPGSLYGAYKAGLELHLKAYHTAYGMNASAWRPATMYGLNSNLQKSIWFDLVKAVTEGKTISAEAYGNVVHVEDVAEALALAVGDESVAGEYYNLVDFGFEWQEVQEIVRKLTVERAIRPCPRSRGLPHRFNSAKAIAFFDHHGDGMALRRGREGVEQYIASLLAKLP
jgi:nucleoside-diphosphate-sugar epimerase